MRIHKKSKVDKNTAEIIRLYTVDCLSCKKIGDIFKVSGPTIANLLIKNNIIPKKESKISKSLGETIIKMYYIDKFSMNQIKQKLNISFQTLDNYFKLLKIQKKTRSEIMTKHCADETYFTTIDTEHKAYWLGFLMADGCIINNDIKKTIKMYTCLSLSHVDKDHILKFKQHIKSDATVYEYKTKEHYINGVKVWPSRICGIKVGSNKIAQDLINLGCVPRKSLILKFPTEKQVPNYLINHFIRGYFDGDGTITRNLPKDRLTRNFSVSFAGTENFLYGIRKIIYSTLDLPNNKVSRCKNSKAYYLSYGGNHRVLKLMEWLYTDATIYLERKYKKFMELKQQGLKNIEMGENHYKSKTYEFIDPKGNRIIIKNLSEFCRNNPSFVREGFKNVHLGYEKQYKGWTKYHPTNDKNDSKLNLSDEK